MKLYPAIDLLEGSCVRLRQGAFDAATVYSQDPIATARAFEAAGADCLHLVDLSGARRPGDRQLKLIAEIIGATRLRVQVGGGLRSLEDAGELLSRGAERVVFGSAVVKDSALAGRLVAEYGAERITLAYDVRIGADGVPRPATHGWQELGARSLIELIGELSSLETLRVLCTDIARDGMMAGPNVKLYQNLKDSFPSIEVQASGGVGTLADLKALKEAGISSAIVGKALYEGAINLKEAILQC